MLQYPGEGLFLIFYPPFVAYITGVLQLYLPESR